MKSEQVWIWKQAVRHHPTISVLSGDWGVYIYIYIYIHIKYDDANLVQY